MCEVIVCCNCGYWGEINEIWRAKVTSTWALVKAAQMKVCVKLSLELWPSVFYRLCFLNVWTLNIRESMPGVVLCHKFMPTHAGLSGSCSAEHMLSLKQKCSANFQATCCSDLLSEICENFFFSNGIGCSCIDPKTMKCMCLVPND